MVRLKAGHQSLINRVEKETCQKTTKSRGPRWEQNHPQTSKAGTMTTSPRAIHLSAEKDVIQIVKGVTLVDSSMGTNLLEEGRNFNQSGFKRPVTHVRAEQI